MVLQALKVTVCSLWGNKKAPQTHEKASTVLLQLQLESRFLCISNRFFLFCLFFFNPCFRFDLLDQQTMPASRFFVMLYLVVIFVVSSRTGGAAAFPPAAAAVALRSESLRYHKISFSFPQSPLSSDPPHLSTLSSRLQLSCFLAFGLISYTTPDGLWSCSWQFSPNLDVITVEVTAQYDGWVSVGFSDSMTMDKTDYVIGWIDANSLLVIDDRYTNPTNSRYSPKTDTSLGGLDNLSNVAGQRVAVNGVVSTTISFSRQCVTDDEVFFCSWRCCCISLLNFFSLFFSSSLMFPSVTARCSCCLHMGLLEHLGARVHTPPAAEALSPSTCCSVPPSLGGGTQTSS